MKLGAYHTIELELQRAFTLRKARRAGAVLCCVVQCWCCAMCWCCMVCGSTVRGMASEDT